MQMSKHIISLCHCLLLLLTICSVSAVGESNRDEVSPVVDSARCIALAEAYLGGEATEHGKLRELIFKSVTHVTSETLPSDVAPEAAKNDVWLVEVESCRFEILTKEAAATVSEAYLVTLLLDSIDGSLVRISCDKTTAKTGGVNSDTRLPAVVLFPMKAVGEEYHGRLGSSSALSFADCFVRSWPLIGQAGEIHALLVEYSSQTVEEPRPAWVLELAGLPPFLPPGPVGADIRPTNERRVIDASTGEVLLAVKYVPNQPQKSE